MKTPRQGQQVGLSVGVNLPIDVVDIVTGGQWSKLTDHDRSMYVDHLATCVELTVMQVLAQVTASRGVKKPPGAGAGPG